MRVLALDSTTRTGSVALVEDGRVVVERAGDASRSQAERLPEEAVAVIASQGLGLADVDVFAVASGPGSFTGLRIGIAAFQGFGVVTGRPVLGVSVLEALGQVGSRDCTPDAIVAAWMDARRREVFSALYRVTSAAPFVPERLVEIEAPAVGDPAATLDRWSPWLSAEVRFIGDGAAAYADVIRSAGGDASHERVPLLAGAIGRLAEVRARRGEAGSAAGVRPLYVRRPDAELDRERRG